MQRRQRAAPEGPPLKAPARESDHEDRALVERVKDKDQKALEALYRRHGFRVFRQANALLGNEAEAEEIVQEVFLAVYEKVKMFRGEAAFTTWLYRVTMNATLSRLRRRKRTQEVPYEDYLPRYEPDGHHLSGRYSVVDWSQEVEKQLANKELQRILREALDQLRPVDKAVVMLSDLEGIPDREIGQALGLSVPAVKARLHRARLFLREALDDYLGERHPPGSFSMGNGDHGTRQRTRSPQ